MAAKRNAKELSNPMELSETAIEELKQAWLAGTISDETMDEVDPDGLVQDDDADDDGD